MTHPRQSSHEWWKDKADPSELAAFTQSYRASQRELNTAGWRRNALLCILAVATAVAIRLITS
ncbi:hypothetical protein ACSFA8_22345 [Variovorax sp. RT4R15]|uniref:hypothetical protein n=1 Tax=Variovorax sp. RT4R15 TaxID=3443737 RepID=UPI003F479E32